MKSVYRGVSLNLHAFAPKPLVLTAQSVLLAGVLRAWGPAWVQFPPAPGAGLSQWLTVNSPHQMVSVTWCSIECGCCGPKLTCILSARLNDSLPHLLLFNLHPFVALLPLLLLGLRLRRGHFMQKTASQKSAGYGDSLPLLVLLRPNGDNEDFLLNGVLLVRPGRPCCLCRDAVVLVQV
jgi:hypothetical protein